MTAAFAALENVLASDPNLGSTGTFSPFIPSTGTWGPAVVVRVMPWQQEEVTEVFGVTVQNPGRGFKVPKADLAVRPRERDRLVVGGIIYTCKAAARGDLEGTEWTLDVDGGDA